MFFVDKRGGALSGVVSSIFIWNHGGCAFQGSHNPIAIAGSGIWAVVSENRESGLLARTVPLVVFADGGNEYCHHYSFTS